MKQQFSAPNAARDLADKTKWQEYERRKQAWIDESLKQPSVAPGVYDAAMRQIARECGV